MQSRWLADAANRVDLRLVRSYDCVMTLSEGAGVLPSPSSALLQLARLKAGLTQRELAERAGVPVTMISAYERDLRQPTLATLLRLLRAGGFDLRLHLAAHDPHDDILARLEAGRSEAERQARDHQLHAWREATPAGDVE
jgi:transcriptional regulator with XRE-family HTH domain